MFSRKIRDIKLVAMLALPLIMAFLAQKGMQLIDTVMMGWIGPQALAAGALGTAIFMTVLVFCRGTISAVGIFIAHAQGASHPHEIKATMEQGLLLTILLSLPAMFIIWKAPQVLSMGNENPVIIQNTTLLLHGLVWGFPGSLLFFLFRELIAVFALARVVMIVSVCSIPLTFAANYVLIYGKYGFPALGIAGIGIAGAIIMWLMFFCLFIYSKRHPTLKEYAVLSLSQFNYRKMSSIFYIGAQSGIITTLDTGMFLLAAVMIGYFGVTALAAYQVAMQWGSIAYNIPLALSVVTSLQVGHAVGAKDIPRAKHFAFLGLMLGLLVSVFVAFFFIVTPDLLIRPFLKATENAYQETHRLAVAFLAITALFQVFDTVQIIANGILRGFKDTLAPLILSVICYWFIGVASAYYFAFHTHFGAMGVWYGLTLGICSVGIVLMLRFLLSTRRAVGSTY